MIFDFKIIYHNSNDTKQTLCDIVFTAYEIEKVLSELNEVFKNKTSKNTDTPNFSVHLNLWESYPDNIDFSKTSNVNSKILSNEYKSLLYTNNITEQDYSKIALSSLFDFILNNIKTMEFQASVFLKELLIQKIDLVDAQ
jgi:hypothetical protein